MKKRFQKLGIGAVAIAVVGTMFAVNAIGALLAKWRDDNAQASGAAAGSGLLRQVGGELREWATAGKDGSGLADKLGALLRKGS